jgi:hypothetical protein
MDLFVVANLYNHLSTLSDCFRARRNDSYDVPRKTGFWPKFSFLLPGKNQRCNLSAQLFMIALDLSLCFSE